MIVTANVTDIDQFRRYQEDEEMSLLELLGRLRRTEPPTEQMLAGTALHKALESCPEGEFETLEADGFRFVIEVDGELPLSPVREMSIAKDYRVGRDVVRVRGRVDELSGEEVIDHKTTSQFDPEHLLAGYQWRLYLDMLGARKFRWNVFVLSPVAKEYRVIRVAALHSLCQFAYPGMRDDIDALLRKFVEFACVHLPERIVEGVAA